MPRAKKATNVVKLKDRFPNAGALGPGWYHFLNKENEQMTKGFQLFDSAGDGYWYWWETPGPGYKPSKGTLPKGPFNTDRKAYMDAIATYRAALELKK